MLWFFRNRKPPLLSARVLESTESDSLPEWMLDRIKELSLAKYELPLLISPDEVDYIASLRLADQCRQLELPLRTIEVDNVKKPEQVALNKYCAAGWKGAACEGSTIAFLAKACLWKTDTLDVTHQLELTPAITRLDELYHEETRAKIYQEVTQTPVEIIANRYADHYTFFKKVLPSTALAQPDDAIQILMGVGRENFFRLVEIILDHPMHSHAGWPDLIIVRGDAVRLIEVKVKDKLHATQIRMMSEISRKKIPLNLEVNRLVRA